MPDRKFGWTVPVLASSAVRDRFGRTRMSYAGRKFAATVPTVRSWSVRAAAVSTVNAVAASNIPKSSATARPARNRNCDQASFATAATFLVVSQARLALVRDRDYCGSLPSDNARRETTPLPSHNARRGHQFARGRLSPGERLMPLHHAVLSL